MNITIKSKDGNELKLKPIRFRDDENSIRFVPINGGQVVIRVVLDGANYKVEVDDNKVDISDNELTRLIDEWLVEVNPNDEFGTEDSEIEEEDINNPYNPDAIRVDTKQFSLRQIYDMIKAGDIDLTPDFQRHLVWDHQRKSRLIESILLRIPLPMFYFSQDEEGKITVVDGLQRLNAIREFMDNELKLRKLEYLEEKCGGRYYDPEKYRLEKKIIKDKGIGNNETKFIDSKYFRWFNMTQITVNVIDPSSPFKLKYDIFRRINTGGQPLNSQEIRNCLSNNNLRQALKEMASLESFKEATGHSIKDVRMEAQELALRFILFLRKYKADKTLNNYSGNIEFELNLLTEEFYKNKKTNLSTFVNSFDNAMKNASLLFGRYAFRKCKIEHIHPKANRQLINKALFVSWSVLLSQLAHDEIKESVEKEKLVMPLAKRITNDQELFLFLTYSTNSKVNIQASFKAANEIIKTNLN
jgi:hypothetical protein